MPVSNGDLIPLAILDYRGQPQDLIDYERSSLYVIHGQVIGELPKEIQTPIEFLFMVPEPSTYALALLGLVGMGLRSRRFGAVS